MAHSPPSLTPPRLVKRRRRQLSCDTCRASKLKCDRAAPICSTCRAHDRTPDQCTRDGVPVSLAPTVPLRPTAPATALTPAAPGHSPPITLPRYSSSPDTPREPRSAPRASHTPTFTSGRISLPNSEASTAPPLPPGQPASAPAVLDPPNPFEPLPMVEESIRPRGKDGSSLHMSLDLAVQARKLLPARLVQVQAMLDLYWAKIAVVSPSYDPGLMHQRTRDLYQLPLGEEEVTEDSLTGLTLPMLAWLCAACSSVLRLAQPTRLLIWGIVDDAAAAARKACELNKMARECLRVACAQGEKALCPMRGCPAALMRIQAAIAITSSASCVAPPPGSSEVLDIAIRYARQAGLDRLGKVSQRPRTLHEYEQAACWLSLVCTDWRAAPYLGCYTVYPGTFTTEWDLSMKELIDAHTHPVSIPTEKVRLSTPASQQNQGSGPPQHAQAGLRSIDPGDDSEESSSDEGHGEAPPELTPPMGSVDHHAAMWVWAWQIRIADEARKLCDLGVHDADQRVSVGYDKVMARDTSLQQLLQSRPPELIVEVKKETQEPEIRTKIKRFPWLLMQAVAVSTPLRTILLSLHMPYVLGGYQLAMSQPRSDQALSISSALEQSVRIVRAAQRASMKGIILHRQWQLRHSLFNAGLLLIFDLLLRNSSLLPPVYPGGAFGQHSIDEEVALAIECLDDSSWRRGRSEVADVPWVNNSDFPSQWLPPNPIGPNGLAVHQPSVGVQHFTDERLERLLVLALRRNGQQGDGALAVDSYMQAYTTDMIGHRRSSKRARTASRRLEGSDILPSSMRSRLAEPSWLLHTEETSAPSVIPASRPDALQANPPVCRGDEPPVGPFNMPTLPPTGASGVSPDPLLPGLTNNNNSSSNNSNGNGNGNGDTGLPGLPAVFDMEGLIPGFTGADGVPAYTAPASVPVPAPAPAAAFGGPFPLLDASYLHDLLQFADSSTGLPVDAILADPFLLNMTNAQFPHP